MKKLFSLLALCLLLQFSMQAQTRHEKKVAAAVEAFRQVLVNPDKVVLENILSEELSFGHSNGKVEGKTTVVEKLVSGRTDWVSVNLKDQTIQVTGKAAVVRHRFVGQLSSNGNVEDINMHVLLVWQKHRGQCQLLARQAVKI